MAQHAMKRRSQGNSPGGAINGKHENGAENGAENGTAKQDVQFKHLNEYGTMGSFIHMTLVPLFLMFFSPNLCIVLWYTACHCDGSFLLFGQKMAEEGVVTGLWNIWMSINYASPLSVAVIGGYMIFAIILQLVVPGPKAVGPVTPKGNTPVYKDNGLYCFLITIASFFVLTYVLKQYGMSPSVVYDHFGEFIGTLTVYSHVLCIILHIKGLIAPSTSDSGSSGNLVFDYYWGTELYPNILGVDIKVFTNCRFGMTVWPLLCLVYTVKSYELHGFVDSAFVSCLLQMLYFTKFFWWESGYMRTIDIMVDRAGFYICWGCLCYIPGVYATVLMYLVRHPIQLGPVLSATFIICGALSIAINYAADRQKQIVRNTNGKCTIWGSKPEVIRAKYELENGDVRESLLLVSGFWGIARHFHYVPELMLTFFWSVPALFDNVMAYTYFIWLLFLLSHRTFRDDAKCGQKYKKYWSQYCQRVPYKMIPGIF